jgi:hypothetical protein
MTNHGSDEFEPPKERQAISALPPSTGTSSERAHCIERVLNRFVDVFPYEGIYGLVYCFFNNTRKWI